MASHFDGDFIKIAVRVAQEMNIVRDMCFVWSWCYDVSCMLIVRHGFKQKCVPAKRVACKPKQLVQRFYGCVKRKHVFV